MYPTSIMYHQHNAPHQHNVPQIQDSTSHERVHAASASFSRSDLLKYCEDTLPVFSTGISCGQLCRFLMHRPLCLPVRYSFFVWVVSRSDPGKGTPTWIRLVQGQEIHSSLKFIHAATLTCPDQMLTGESAAADSW